MPTLRLLPLLLTCTALAGGAGLRPVRVPQPPAALGLRTCSVGDLRLTTDLHGRLRSVQHGQNVPDNSLSVRQSYDRAGRLSSVTVQWSGFAGLLLDLRGSFDSAGRLVKETGYRRPGITTPISSYVRTVPAGQRC